MQPGDILDGTICAGFRWSEQTREKYRKGYGRWLTFLIVSGRFDQQLAPGERITPDVVRDYIEVLSGEVSSWTLWGRLAALLAAIKVIDPERDWAWLRRVVRFYESRVVDSRNKLQSLRSAEEIVNWAYNRLDQISNSAPEHHTAVHYRNALMVGLLIQCPIRLGNLVMIRIDKHLVPHAHGYSLAFDRTETKTRKPLSVPVPESLAPYIETYLTEHRPLLLQGKDDDHLWITQYGQPMTNKSAHSAITKTTESAFGTPINPHLFRDCAATFVAVNDPKHVGIAAPILGHTDPRTTERHYIQANALEAGRRLRQSVDTLRKALPEQTARRQKES